MEEKLFKLINRYSNDQFSEMDKLTLDEILKELDNYYLGLRWRLNVPDITFGVEIEVEHTHTKRIQKKIKKDDSLSDWTVTGDSSLDDGCEVVSPILTNTSDCYKSIKDICEIITKNGSIDNHSAGHIHIGSQILGENKDSWINLAGIWSVYENIFYRFLYGEYLTPRTSLKDWAKPMASMLYARYMTFANKESMDNTTARKVITIIRLTRDSAINFGNVYKNGVTYNPDNSTIEFRCPNGTLDPVIWQNNVNLVTHILDYSNNKNFNRDLISEKAKKIESYSLDEYNKIDLNDALEVCDLIFNNNIDKIYFLRQYLKSYQTSNKPLTKAKKFTK